MDVTTDNFQDVLKELKSLIDKCDFISIDCEFTGLDEAPATAIGTLRSASSGMANYTGMTAEEELQSRYEKIKASTMFLVVQVAVLLSLCEFVNRVGQVGICVFTWNAQTRSFIATPYNFYVFPREFKGLDRRFLCQAKCMSFLSSNHMDFNKLIKSGISYLNKQEEEYLREGITTKETEFIAGIRETIAEFLADETRSILILPQYDSYHRMLIHRDLSETFDDCFKKENVTKNERTSSLGQTKAKIVESISNMAQKVEDKQIQAAIGFRHVIDHISSSKKGLSFSGGTRLDAVFRTVMHDPFKKPIISLQDGCDKYKNNAQLHEAGYDAYMTGCVLIRCI
eukprot:746214-Hanusia_phi.AAC.6